MTKELSKGDLVLITPSKESLADGSLTHEFQARVVNIYDHAIIVIDQEENVWDCFPNEVGKIEE